MVPGLKARAERRAAANAAAIRGLLSQGNTSAALTEAVRGLRSEAAKLRGWRPADGALADAEIAGSIAALAAQLSRYKPHAPATYPVPPERLLDAFESAYLASWEEQ